MLLPAAWKISRARFIAPEVLPILVVAPNWPPPAVNSPVDVTVPPVIAPHDESLPLAVSSPVDVIVPPVMWPVAEMPPVEVSVAAVTVPRSP